jgi:alkylated DNA repair dioxygenase AlkB
MLQSQPQLFATEPELPAGMVYQQDFLSIGEEAELLPQLAALPFAGARYKEWTARRRTVGFGARFDFDTNKLYPAADIPPVFLPLRERIAAWAGRDASQFQQLLVNEYAPGTPLGWHRDAPCFEHVVGVSLAGPARMRLRPYPPPSPGRAAAVLDLPPRSAYQLSGAARWAWQHAISPTSTLRYSITFRTLSQPATRPTAATSRASPTSVADQY